MSSARISYDHAEAENRNREATPHGAYVLLGFGFALLVGTPEARFFIELFFPNQPLTLARNHDRAEIVESPQRASTTGCFRQLQQLRGSSDIDASGIFNRQAPTYVGCSMHDPRGLGGESIPFGLVQAQAVAGNIAAKR